MRHSILSKSALHLGAVAFAALLAVFPGRSEANRADLDLAFGVDGIVRLSVASGGFNDVLVQPDGKIVAVGMSGADWLIARFNTDGSLDAGFGSGGVRTVTPPPTSGAAPQASAVALDASGRALIAGGPYVARFASDGSLDASYGTAGFYAIPLSPQQLGLLISDIIVASNGGFLLSCGVYGDASLGYIAAHTSALKLAADGSVDATFGTNGFATKFGLQDRVYNETYAVAEWNGNIYVAGRSGTRGAFYKPEVVRFTATGQLDTSFGVDGALVPIASFAPYGTNAITDLALQSGGLVVAGRGISSAEFMMSKRTARITAAGQVDPTFASGDVRPSTEPWSRGLLVDSDDRVVLATRTTTPVIAGFLADGTVDSGFGVAGLRDAPFDGQSVNTMTLQQDGKYLLAGGTGSAVAYLSRLRGTAIIPPEVSTTPATGTLLSTSGGLPGTTQSLGAIQFANRGSDALVVSGCSASSVFSASAAFPLTIAQGVPQSVSVSCQMPATPLTSISGTLVCSTNDADEPQVTFALQCISGAGAGSATSIPTLGRAAQALLGVLVAVVAIAAMRRRLRVVATVRLRR